MRLIHLESGIRRRSWPERLRDLNEMKICLRAFNQEGIYFSTCRFTQFCKQR